MPTCSLTLWLVGLCLSIGSLLCAWPSLANEAADAGEAADTDPALRPVSSVLPVGVFRVRSPFVHTSGNTGFSKEGVEEDMGFRFERVSQIVALDYGLSESVSLSVAIPIVYSDKLGLEAVQLRSSTFYQDSYDDITSDVSQVLIEERICSTVSNCRRLIKEGYALPRDKSLTLSGGEEALLRAGVPIRNYIDSVIVNAVAPEEGDTGIGDIELAALYELIRLRSAGADEVPFGLALGVGLRFPTGSFEEVPRSRRPTGRGTIDLGLQLATDVLLERHTILSFQVTGEIELIAAQKRRSRTTDGRKFIGDGSERFSREPVRSSGFVRLEYGLAGLAEVLSLATLEGRFKFASEPTEKLGGEVETESHQSQSLLAGGRMSLLEWGIPVVAGALYEHTLSQSGKPSFVAPTNVIAYLELYYQF